VILGEHTEVPVNPSYREFLDPEMAEARKNVVVQPSPIEAQSAGRDTAALKVGPPGLGDLLHASFGTDLGIWSNSGTVP
jgi:hypothetical protein